jgi:DNA helicase-2/ATP-dependent DNA helicase PcrA
MIGYDLKNEYYKLRDAIIENQFKYLDEEQKKAVFSSDRNILVLACPGSGKTTVLINRVLYLTKYGQVYGSEFIPENLGEKDLDILREYVHKKDLAKNKREEDRLEYLIGFKKVHPSSIIVITFTKAAAQNMKKRYQELSHNSETPFFGTFHGLFYKLLIRHFGKLNIIDSSEAYRVISSVLTKHLDEVSEDKIKDIRSRISLFKCSEIDMVDFDSHIEKDIFINCYKVYESYKNEKGLLDFDDIQIKFKNFLIKNPNSAELYRKAFRYLLIDEFQDIDNLQLNIMRELNKYNSIFGVGDEDQCIYSFRGSRPDYMVDFETYFEGGKKLYLSTNYRSAKSIVGISESLIKNNVMRNQKSMAAWKKDNKIIEVTKYYDENSEAEDIALNVEKLRSLAEYNYKECAVLYRTNIESRSLIDAFIRKRIPFKLLEKEYNFFDHFICKDLTSYLKLSIISDDVESFKRIINKPFRYISKVSLEKLSNSSIRCNCFDFLKELEETPVFQIKNLDKLQKEIYNLNRMSLPGAIQYIITGLGYHDYIKEYSQKFKIQLLELEDILEEFKEAAVSCSSIIAFLSHIEKVTEELNKSTQQSNDEDRVILSTIHGVKGMEFKNVFVINCIEEMLPHSNNINDNIEEERRLFYVALTRTIDNVFLCIPRNMRGKHTEPSRFIEECSLNLLEDLENLYKTNEEIVHSSFGKGRIININENVVEIKFENEINRKFDIMVLHNKGILKKTN